MKITSFDIYEYALALKEPLYIRGKAHASSRQGLILHLKSDSHEGLGETAPLPGVSRETLDDAKKQLLSLRSSFIHQPLPEHLEKLNGKFRDWLGTELKPSVQFGFETAVLNLIAKSKNLPLHRLLTHSFHDHIRVHGLLRGSKSEILAQAKKLIDQGFHELKLKVGESLQEDIEKVQALNALTQDVALLHLDANQAWNLNDAVAFGNEVGLAAVDYIEEPFKNIEHIPDFFNKTTIPVALDESLLKVGLKDIRSLDGVDILILKPTLLGGIEKAYALMEETKRLGIVCLVSSCYESGIGILALANLAGCTSRDRSAGLDTLKFFKEDILKDPFKIEHGKMDISQRHLQIKDIRLDMCKKVI